MSDIIQVSPLFKRPVRGRWITRATALRTPRNAAAERVNSNGLEGSKIAGSCTGRPARMNHETDVSAQQSAPEENPRVSRADEHEEWPAGAQAPAGQGSEAAGAVSRARGELVGKARGPAALGPSERIRRRLEFQLVHEKGTRTPGQFMTVLFLPNDLRRNRLGVVASRRLGGAVQRNKAKRLIRQAFRLNKPAASGWDVVVIPKMDLLDADFTAIEADFRGICQRHGRRFRA